MLFVPGRLLISSLHKGKRVVCPEESRVVMVVMRNTTEIPSVRDNLSSCRSNMTACYTPGFFGNQQ